MVGQNCPHWRSGIQYRFAFGCEERSSRASAFSEEELKLAGAPEASNWCWLRTAETKRYVDCYRGTTDVPNVCLSSLCLHLQRQKFSIIWPDIRMRKTPSTASFIGGCSMPASKNGRRKLQRPSRNSSSKVFSKKNDLRMATYFTTSHRNISRRFSNSHHETLLLTQPRKPSNKKVPSCLPR